MDRRKDYSVKSAFVTASTVFSRKTGQWVWGENLKSYRLDKHEMFSLATTKRARRHLRGVPDEQSSGAHCRGLWMQLPPSDIYNFPITDEDRGPPGYKWDDNYPGTMKPGLVEDNYPLKDVMESEVYNNMVYDEFDMDERCCDVCEPDLDFLEWLSKEGRLIPREAENDEIEMEPDAQLTEFSEDDMDYNDDSKMIAYYSRQTDENATSTDFEFSGFSDTPDYDAEF